MWNVDEGSSNLENSLCIIASHPSLKYAPGVWSLLKKGFRFQVINYIMCVFSGRGSLHLERWRIVYKRVTWHLNYFFGNILTDLNQTSNTDENQTQMLYSVLTSFFERFRLYSFVNIPSRQQVQVPTLSIHFIKLYNQRNN